MRRVLIVLLALAAWHTVAMPGGPARAAGASPHTVVAVDIGAARASVSDAEMAETVVRIAAGAASNGVVALVAYGSDAPEPLTFEHGSEGLAQAVEDLVAAVGKPSAEPPSDQFKALAAVYGYLGDRDAAEGSRLLLVTSDGLDGESADSRQRLLSFADLFADEGWQVDAAVLPGASPSDRRFLASLSQATAGMSFDLGTLDGLSSFVNSTLGLAPAPVIETELAVGTPALSPIEVAPHTESLTVSVLRQDPEATVELFDPRGAPVEAGRVGVEVVDTPAAVIIKVLSPEAGRWLARGVGAGSGLLVTADLKNPLRVRLMDDPPFPVGEPAVLRAVVAVGDEPRALPGSSIEAAVSANGNVTVYELRDDGVSGDAKAGDGIYSVVLPAPERQAINEVSLTLRWDNLGAKLTGRGVYKTEHFPVLTIHPRPAPEVEQGGTVALGELRVNVEQYPYPVSPRSVSVSVTGADGGRAAADAVPIDPLPDGRAWKYRIDAAPGSSGAYDVRAELRTLYLGRQYVSRSPVAPVDVKVTLPPPETGGGLPAWALALIAVGALAVVAPFALILAVRRHPHPYGYLYDDRGRVFVEFRRLRHHGLRRLFARNRIFTDEVPGLTIRDGEFVFTRRGVVLRKVGKLFDVRVNGRPAGPVVPLGRDVQLGVGGRLLTFRAHRRRSRPVLDGTENGAHAGSSPRVSAPR